MSILSRSVVRLFGRILVLALSNSLFFAGSLHADGIEDTPKAATLEKRLGQAYLQAMADVLPDVKLILSNDRLGGYSEIGPYDDLIPVYLYTARSHPQIRQLLESGWNILRLKESQQHELFSITRVFTFIRPVNRNVNFNGFTYPSPSGGKLLTMAIVNKEDIATLSVQELIGTLAHELAVAQDGRVDEDSRLLRNPHYLAFRTGLATVRAYQYEAETLKWAAANLAMPLNDLQKKMIAAYDSLLIPAANTDGTPLSLEQLAANTKQREAKCAALAHKIVTTVTRVELAKLDNADLQEQLAEPVFNQGVSCLAAIRARLKSLGSNEFNLAFGPRPRINDW